jgi:ribosomal protein S18 acetylase RimI-like enzyme
VSSAPRVWRAQPAEAADVARLLIAFRDWLESSTPVDDFIHGAVERLIKDAATEYLLAAGAEDGGACGVCQLRFRESVWTPGFDCWIEDVFVLDDARGKGVGRELVRVACERARERGAGRIELDTSESNTAAISLYESLGFSTSSKAHGKLHGRDLFMGRRL